MLVFLVLTVASQTGGEVSALTQVFAASLTASLM